MKVHRVAYVSELTERDLTEPQHLLSLLESDAAYCSGPLMFEPFALSLSKGFDRLNPNGS